VQVSSKHAFTLAEMTVEEDEDFVVDQIITEREKKELETDEFHDFEDLSDDFKLERLQNLVKQSQLFSNIISDTLLESSLAKKRQREKDEDVSQIKKVRRNEKGQKSIINFFRSDAKSKGNDNDTDPKSDGTATNTIKQPSLVSGTEMREYQLEGTEWLISLFENGLNGILADEMGLGKTIQAIALLAFLFEQGIKGPFLITAPLSTVGNWCKEFAKFAPTLPVLSYIGTKDERKILRDENFNSGDKLSIVVTSYETVLRDFEYLNKINWKFLIVDEGHRLKNINCKLIKTLKRLNTSNRLLLTGTPLQNNLNELWSLLNFILPDIFHDLESFQKWFDFSSLTNLSNKVKDDSTKQLIDSKIQESLVSNLHTILKPFLLRRLKKDVIKNLPLKKEFIIYGNLTSIQSELYKNALYKSLRQSVLKFAFLEHFDVNKKLKYSQKDIKDYLDRQLNPDYIEVPSSDDEEEQDSKEKYLRSRKKANAVSKKEQGLNKIWFEVNRAVSNKSLQNLMMQLRLICNSPYLFYFPWEPNQEIKLDKLLQSSAKLQILDQLLTHLIDKGHKVLIFSQFTKMLDLIQDYLELKKLKFSRFDGSTNQSDREIEITEFNNDYDTKVFLLSTRSGGLGINLTQADSVIIFDSDWNPQVDLQAMDRVHRIGQTKPVIIYRLVMSNTIEQVILAKADSKRKLEKLVIQLGRFESLKKLLKKDSTLTFDKKTKADQESNLAKELTLLLEDDRFKASNNTNAHTDSKGDNVLTEEELSELLDRTPEAYNRATMDYEQFPHIQVFETQNAIQ
jgi:ATP-dependent DNA helicase